MAQIVSESQAQSRSMRGFFVPSWPTVILYLLLSGIILVLLNLGSIIDNLSNHYIGSPDSLKANFSTLFKGFSDSFSSAWNGRLGQVLLWACIGAAAYIAIWLGKNVLNSFENDIIAAHYQHPTDYNRTGYWGSMLSVKIFLAAMIFVTVGFIFMSVTAVLPALAALAGSAAYDFHPASSTFYITACLLSGTVLIYLLVVLCKLVAHLWKAL
jgi:hypothetical protein